MDNNTMAQLMTTVSSLENKVNQLTKELNKLMIDKQQFVPLGKTITPGISPKVAYDSNGMILQGMKLDVSDIPQLPITQIIGLKSQLDSIADTADVKKITNDLKKLIVSRSSESVSSATKVNYDANGFVVSGSQLTSDDIPTLPISKIDGLSDIISIINSLSESSNNSRTSSNTTDNITKSGTFTKVSVDSSGRVTNGDRLTINDLPIDLINRINQLESKIIDTTPIELFNRMNTAITKKIDSNTDITPGTYSKLTVDSKGLVVSGDKLTIDDLPNLTMDCIEGLKGELNKTAKYTDIIDLNNSMSQIISSIQSIGDVNQLKTSLHLKADADQVVRLEKEFTQFKKNIAAVEENLPSELILTQLENIASRIDTIEGRLSVVESKINS